MPKIKKVTQEELLTILGISEVNLEDFVANGAFVKPDTIYILDNIDNATLAHEMFHYLCPLKGEVTRGLIYEKNGFEMGRALNEGVTNYFTSLLYPLTSDVYEYETYVGETLACLFGLDTLKDSYFSSDVSKLREAVVSALHGTYEAETDINNIQLDQFDILATSLYGYYLLLSAEQAPVAFAAMDSIEEMLINCSKQLGKTDVVMENQKEFLDEHSHLKPYTHFRKMW